MDIDDILKNLEEISGIRAADLPGLRIELSQVGDEIVAGAAFNDAVDAARAYIKSVYDDVSDISDEEEVEDEAARDIASNLYPGKLAAFNSALTRGYSKLSLPISGDQETSLTFIAMSYLRHTLAAAAVKSREVKLDLIHDAEVILNRLANPALN